MEADYIVVGFGLAGMCITYQLEREGKKVVVVDADYTKASKVAAGMYNPTILKRFTLAWKGDEHLDYAMQLYNDLNAYLGVQTTCELPVFRKFTSIEEQNTWFQAIDQPKLSRFLSPYLKNSPSKAIEGDYKFGEVKETGRFLFEQVYQKYKDLLLKKERLIEETFDNEDLKVSYSSVLYQDITAKGIIFCEGYRLKENTLFNYLPVLGNKGSYLIIKCPNLKLKVAVKSKYFLIPLGNDLYKFGATYEHQYSKESHDLEVKAELEAALKLLVSAPFEIVIQTIGVRPTVKDRRPLIGNHPMHNNIFVFNGLGTRGVTLAPKVSMHLSNFIVKGIPISKELDISRYNKLYKA